MAVDIGTQTKEDIWQPESNKMHSTPASGWTQLTTSKSKKQCPKLFYNFSSCTKDGLTIHLTDLISLWRCSLSPSDIIATATEQHTSIDPTESNEQMLVLLEKLAGSLSHGKNVLVQQHRPKQSRSKSLTLRTSISLPKPLKPLTWTFTLLAQPASELAEQILRPALHQIDVSRQQMEDLLIVVKEKDHVIEKLLDRVVEKGVDMSLIFPTLTGHGKRGGGGVKVEDAKRLVPGMRQFEKEAWEEKFIEMEKADRDELAGTTLGLEELVKGCEKCIVHSSEEHEAWLESLPGVEVLENGMSKSGTGTSQSQSQPVVKGDGDEPESENEFETQATPPRLKNKRPTPADDGVDTSEDEIQQPATKKAKTSKIGALSSRKQNPNPLNKKQEIFSSPVHQPSPSPPSRRRRNSDASTATETASDSNPESLTRHMKAPLSDPIRLGDRQKNKSATPSLSDSKSANRSSSPPAEATPTESKASTHLRRLGRIGKAKERTDTKSPIPTHTQAEVSRATQSHSQPPTPSRKLGRLGMRNTAKQSQTATVPEVTRPEDGESSTTMRKRAVEEAPSERDNNVVTCSTLDNSEDTASSPSSSPVPSRSKPQPLSTSTSKSAHLNAPNPQPRSHSQLDKQTNLLHVAAAHQNQTKTPHSREQPHPKGNAGPEAGSKPEPNPNSHPTPEPEPEPQTEATKAARRREELKKTISAGGAVKKRRF